MHRPTSIAGIILLLLGGCSSDPVPETIDAALQQSIEALVADFEGDVGIYVRHLPTGRSAAIQADSLFPTASMIKVPILLTLFHQIDAGNIDYFSEVTYHDSLYYGGAGLLQSFKSGQSLSISALAMMMMSLSDNAGALWLQSMVGGGTAINKWLDINGYEATRVNSRTPGREAAYQKYYWGQTTPREMAAQLVMIREGRAVSPAASEEMYRIMTRNYWDGSALSQVPPTVQAAAKWGAMTNFRSEAVLVNAPSGDYVFCVIANNLADERWTADNAGQVLLRDVSRLLWETFEPGRKWQPAEGVEVWY